MFPEVWLPFPLRRYNLVHSGFGVITSIHRRPRPLHQCPGRQRCPSLLATPPDHRNNSKVP